MYPFILSLVAVLTSGAQGSLFYTVPNTEKISISKLIFSSTGAWSLLDFRDTTGKHYTNAGSSNPVPSAVFPSGANNNNALWDFGIDLELAPGVGFTIDIIDTSGAGNTVRLALLTQRGDANA